ncbi:type II toxin-antitoxin system HicB family antitoxin [Anoxybacillus sp. TBDG-1]
MAFFPTCIADENSRESIKNKKRQLYLSAIFDGDNGGMYVEFSELSGCFTCGDTKEEALQMAKEALALHLYGLEQENKATSEPCSK